MRTEPCCPTGYLPVYQPVYLFAQDGVTCCCGEHRAGSERDELPLIEEASRDQLGAHEPEEPYSKLALKGPLDLAVSEAGPGSCLLPPAPGLDLPSFPMALPPSLCLLPQRPLSQCLLPGGLAC
ncbi:hypothetical protein EYF80_027273 [Liparis tanakae]|uniref:Uncharacterized protein n=1 Tax=Liparis tanakae TaxID=230148 RepID=A0A4Z2HAC6_9TELE|nr:hypothetical protein EYF80_027273 [Liparis tanakae]